MEAEMCRIWIVMEVEQNGFWLYRFLVLLITQTKFGVKWEVRYRRLVDSDRPEECTNWLDTGYSFSNSFPTMVVILMMKKKREVRSRVQKFPA